MPRKNKQPNPSLTKSTQSSLLISEIKDGVVVLRDGSVRAVIRASAVNFDLMSRGEQDAVEYAYQAFLNSLHFPIQIIIRSQRIDLDDYLDNLNRLRTEQDNQLLALLMEDYILNIRSLLEEVNIMDKQFYIVVPYFPPLAANLKGQRGSLLQNVTGIFKPREVSTLSETQFQQYKTELSQRVQLVASGLAQFGVRAIPLSTQELIDLYYTAHNPDVALNQKLVDAHQLMTPVVTAGPYTPGANPPPANLPPVPPAPGAQQ